MPTEQDNAAFNDALGSIARAFHDHDPYGKYPDGPWAEVHAALALIWKQIGGTSDIERRAVLVAELRNHAEMFANDRFGTRSLLSRAADEIEGQRA